MTEDEQKDLRGIADGLAADLDYACTLTSAAGDKIIFYLENRKLLGPYRDLLSSHALELENLVCLTGRFLERMNGKVRTLTDLAYEIDTLEDG